MLLECVMHHLVFAQTLQQMMEQLVMMVLFALNWTHVKTVSVLVQVQLLVLLLINVMLLEHVIQHLVFAQIQLNLMVHLVMMEILVP